MTPTLEQCGDGARCARRWRFRFMDRILVFMAVLLHPSNICRRRHVSRTLATRRSFQASDRIQVQGSKPADGIHAEGCSKGRHLSRRQQRERGSRSNEACRLHQSVASDGGSLRRIHLWCRVDLWTALSSFHLHTFCASHYLGAHFKPGE